MSKRLFTILKDGRQSLEKADSPLKQANWTPLSDEHIGQEYEWEYKPQVSKRFGDVWPTPDHFKAAVRGGNVVPMTPEMASKIKNRSGTGSIEELKSLTSQYRFPRDVDRIVEGLHAGHPIPTPLVLHDPDTGAMHMMSGNTRTDAALIEGFQPHVTLVDLPNGWKQKLGKSTLEKRSKNVREQTRNITPEQAESRRVEYAKKLGLKPKFLDRFFGEFPPASADNTVHHSKAFPIEHEAGHYLMTPPGQHQAEYLHEIGNADSDSARYGEQYVENKTAENVANQIENRFDRRSGVGVGAKGGKPLPHVNTLRFAPNVPVGREEQRDAYLKEHNIKHFYSNPKDAPAALGQAFGAKADAHIERFDDGAKFKPEGGIEEASGVNAKINARAKAKKSDLSKGANGDWKKEGGYKFHTKWQPFSDGEGRYLHISVTHDSTGHDRPWEDPEEGGSSIANASFFPPHKDETSAGGAEWVATPWTHEAHTRKGIASSMYALAEKTAGMKLRPDDAQTSYAKKLWAQSDRPFGKSALKKGANGDWKAEGYTIHHEIIPSEQTSTPHWYPEGKLRVFAKDKNGIEAGSTSINHAHTKTLMKPRGISVGDGHERKGLATAMYQHAEKVMGKKMVPQDGHQTPGGAALWLQSNRPFGRKSEKKIDQVSERDINDYNQKLGMGGVKKSDSLDKGLNGDWKTEGYRFKVTHRKHAGFVVRAYKGRQNVGHLAMNDRAGPHGYHDVHTSDIQPDHRGKGLYQEMIRQGITHVQSLGSKGLRSQGFQRSGSATRAWQRVGPEVQDGSAGGNKTDDFYADERHLGLGGVKKSETGKAGEQWETVLSAARNGKLKAQGDLEKGAMKRFPYNPEVRDTTAVDKPLYNWQLDANATWREKLPKMVGNERTRALHKLSGNTQTKLAPDGKRLFLLHRGMGSGEKAQTIDPAQGSVSHAEKHSSWTPHFRIAHDFAREYHTNSFDRNKGVTSAWVHEDDIHTIPKQYGDYAEPTNREIAAADGSNLKFPEHVSVRKPNHFQNEHEVVVRRGHRSQIAEAPKHITGLGPWSPELITNLDTRINERDPRPKHKGPKERGYKNAWSTKNSSGQVNLTALKIFKAAKKKKLSGDEDPADNVKQIRPLP